MELVPDFVNAALIVLVGFALTYIIRDRFREQDRLIDARFAAVDQRFDAVDQRFDRLENRVDRLAADMTSLRSDLTNVALAVGAKNRPQTG